jgi:hypothetical protein
MKTGDFECTVQHNRPNADQIWGIYQIMEKTDFKKAYDSVRREVLYNILIRVWGTHEASQIE